MIVECFARRIMAPFQGVLQVVRMGHGEAESRDGRHWVLYAAHPDILAHSGLSEVRFGTWSEDRGLRRAMVRGTAAGSLVECIGEALIGALEAFAAQVPFPLHDRREFWLLDTRTHEPLVLIDSLLTDEAVPPAQHPRWLPGRAARDEFADLAELEQSIAQRAGRRPLAKWFERDSDGNATGPRRTRYSSELFPRFMLTMHWPHRRQRRLAQAFIEWWAPALLQLSHLSDPERVRLERAAARRAPALARMQASNDIAAHYEEPFLWCE